MFKAYLLLILASNIIPGSTWRIYVLPNIELELAECKALTLPFLYSPANF